MWQSPSKKDLAFTPTKSTRPPKLRAVAALLLLGFFTLLHKYSLPCHHHTRNLTEALYLSIPNPESALEASRAYASHPHLSGSSEDLLDVKTFLHFLQDELGIPKPPHLPIYNAGSPLSRNATLLLVDPHASPHPTAWVDTYFPVMNTGLDQSLEILDNDGQSIWSADLVEDGDPRDEDAHKYRDTIPPWHGLSAGGDVTGQLIYANYGGKEDYDQLVAQRVNLTGKIVIARYGRLYRGLKIQRAQELGVAGVLLYSDPRDDGFVTVKNDYAPYPAGPARNPSSVQRGSAVFLSTYPGDPTTPGYPAYEDAERTAGENIPKIPSLPISWQNAQRLFEEIGDVYIQNEDGQKVLSGKTSSNQIRLVNHVDTKVIPIWNVMASIPGHIRDEVVIIGCHRDAWVMGAADPVSGTVALREVIRGFGALLRKGWRPLRTIVFASWDGEEYGLVGSTEWGEDFPTWISDHVAAYLNLDTSVSGSRWVAVASPSLAHIIKQTALDIPHPTITGKTLWEARDDIGPFDDVYRNQTIDAEYLARYNEVKKKSEASKTNIPPLGSGSDYTVFLQRLGVASVDQGFGHTPTDAVYHYHSIYDTQAWQERYGDPGFARHVAVAKIQGLLALRIVDSIILPLNTTQYAFELDEYLDTVESLVPTLGKKAKEVEFSSLRTSIRNLQETSLKLDQEKFDAEKELKKLLKRLPLFPGRSRDHCRKHGGVLRQVADWIKGVFGVPPPTEAELSLPTVDSLEEYLLYVSANGDETHKEWGFPVHRFIKAAKRISRVNKKLTAFERGFISEEGIKERVWYRHLGVAPGKWLGYGATTFPALTEAITLEKNVTLIYYEANRLKALLDKLANDLAP